MLFIMISCDLCTIFCKKFAQIHKQFAKVCKQFVNAHSCITLQHTPYTNQLCDDLLIMYASYCSLVHELLCELCCNYYVVHELLHESLLTKLLVTPIYIYLLWQIIMFINGSQTVREPS